jgi:hypothetical protein
VAKKTPRIRIALPVATIALLLTLVPGAFAAPGGGKGGNTSTGGGSLSLVMVTDSNSNGLPNWGDVVTFKVSTNAAMPTVTLACTQNGVSVYRGSAGFYAGYPWPWAQNFTLNSGAWSGGGAADCTATLTATSSNGKVQTLATLNFAVGA